MQAMRMRELCRLRGGAARRRPTLSAGWKELVALHEALRGDELAVVARSGGIGRDVVLAVAPSRERRDAVRPAQQTGRVDTVVEQTSERLHAVHAGRDVPDQ